MDYRSFSTISRKTSRTPPFGWEEPLCIGYSPRWRTIPLSWRAGWSMCPIPIDIEDRESIVRAVMSPSHVDEKRPSKLKPAAFRSRAGTDDVSVIRHTYMGSNFCKKHGKARSGYVGLAAITAGSIRSTSSTIHDSRIQFLGHAHISHGLILPPNEPPGSADNMIITERCRALCALATFYRDPEREHETWTGPPI